MNNSREEKDTGISRRSSIRFLALTTIHEEGIFLPSNYYQGKELKKLEERKGVVSASKKV